MAAATAASGAFAVLSTTFTPPAACATQFMMLANDQYRIWMNPLSPAVGITATSCYASQWLQSYSTAAFSPLVCPSGYQTQTAFASPSGYIACCPRGFNGVALVSGAPVSRPASGATCYSGIYNSGIYLTQYGLSSATATTVLTATDTNAQAYAYAYDGFAVTAATPTPSSGASNTAITSHAASHTSSSTAQPDSNTSIGGGAIAGIVVGVIVGIALLTGLLALYLRRRRRRAKEDAVHELHGNSAFDAGHANAVGAADVKDKKLRHVSELSAVRKTSELAAANIPLLELPGSEAGSPAREGREEGRPGTGTGRRGVR